MKVDLNKKDMELINSARKVASFNEEINRSQQIVYNIKPIPSKKDEILVAGAEANIEQLKLLKEELEKSKRYNRWMMVITIIALLVAVVEIITN